MPIAPALLLLADARFPTGGHAHSAGTEQAVAIGDVHDVDSLGRYLRARLATTGRTDAAFTAFTCRVMSDRKVHQDRNARVAEILAEHAVD